jgi:hypothetical protein
MKAIEISVKSIKSNTIFVFSDYFNAKFENYKLFLTIKSESGFMDLVVLSLMKW